MNVIKSLIIPISILVFFGCSEKAELVSNSPLENSLNPVSVSNLIVSPGDSILRFELPLVNNQRRIDYTISGKLLSSKSETVNATVSIVSLSSGSIYEETFTLNLNGSSNNLLHTGKIFTDDEVLTGSSSSFKITDGNSLIFSTSNLFKFKNDANFSIKIDSVVFSPKNSVKINEEFTMTAFVSYSSNPENITSVSYTGRDPNGTALTPREFTVTSNPKVWVFPKIKPLPGTPLGVYKRNFVAKDKFGNTSPVFETTHSVIQ